MAGISKFLSSLRMTAELISSRSGISVSRVEQLFSDADVTSAELRALSRGLRLSLRSFAEPEAQKQPLQTIRFRNTQAIDRFDPISQYFEGFIEATLSILPRRPAPPDWIAMLWADSHKNFKDAENAAVALRASLYRRHESEPAIGLPQRLNSFQGVVLNQLPQSKFEGASLIYHNYVFIFVSPRFAGRMLFTLAHELGHIIAHHSIDAWHCDMAGDIGRFRRSEEGYADAFASAFLLPSEGVGEVLSAVRKRFHIKADQIGDVEILYLSRFFGVSFDVAARRCEFLGLLPTGGALSIAERLRKDFKSPEQRANQFGIPPLQAANIDRVSPTILMAAKTRIADGSISLTWLAERLRVSVEQLQRANALLQEPQGVAH